MNRVKIVTDLPKGAKNLYTSSKSGSKMPLLLDYEGNSFERYIDFTAPNS